MKPRPPKSASAEKAQSAQLHLKQTAWSGPLPPPEVLTKFDAAIPGSAERILRMAEIEQAHRIDLERATVASDNAVRESIAAANKLGLWLGGSISILAVIGAVVAALFGVRWEICVALVGLPLMSAIRAIVNRQ